jgi:anaerobic ribonucleoside-triphosphate reductase
MNKVITINLDGIAYQLEEGGYDALRAYLETAAARLQGNRTRMKSFRISNGRSGRSSALFWPLTRRWS